MAFFSFGQPNPDDVGIDNPFEFENLPSIRGYRTFLIGVSYILR